MLDRLRPLLRSFVPFTSGRGDGTESLRTLRLSMVLLAVFNPLFWVVYHTAAPEAVDPTAARVVMLVGAFVLLGLSYADTVVRRRPYEVLAAVLYGMLGWFGWLTFANDLSGPYALGYLFVVVAVAMVYSAICPSPRPMAGMLVVASGIGLGVALGVETPEIAPSVFMVGLVPGAVIVYIAFAARLTAVRALDQSERRLAEAERLAQTGSWSVDLGTGERTWSVGAERLLGTGIASATDLADLVHPEDRDALREAHGRLGDGMRQSDLRVRIVRPGGETRHVRLIARHVAAAGAPQRLECALLDVTDQVAHEAELRAARDRAEEAAALKASFLANMSHEIRTPLTAIIGFAQLLREDVGASHTNLVEPIESGGRRLLGTLNSVLDLARMEAGETDLRLVPTDAAAEVRGVAEMMAAQAEARGIALSVDVPAQPVYVLGDAGALSRVVTNLVSNAIKFTEAGGVSVALQASGGRVEVEVADTGVGMSEVFLDRLFQPFQQASSGWGRRHEGTGLGLTISRRLVEAMDGTIAVESQAGVGTRFVASFLAAPEAESPDAVLSAPEPLAA